MTIEAVFSAQFSPTGSKIVSASNDYTAKIWLSPQGIVDWLKTASIERLTQKDLEDLLIDFVNLKEYGD
jgi:hypothetical protein